MSLVSILKKKNRKALFTTPSHGGNVCIFHKFYQWYRKDISEIDAYNPTEEEELKDKEGDKIFEEHLKYIDELERQKQEALKQQILREKKNRDAQIKDEFVRKRIEHLKQRKFEKALIKNIQQEMEKEKQAAIQKKLKENEALKKVIKENEINKQKQKELLQKEKEELAVETGEQCNNPYECWYYGYCHPETVEENKKNEQTKLI